MISARDWAALVMLLALLGTSVEAAAQSIDAARAARDKAKTDLIRAQEAFDRADEAYIKALGGAAAKPAPPAGPPAQTVGPPAQAASAGRPGVVTFSLSGPRALEANPLDFRGRLIIDGEPGAWTEHASGARIMVPPEAGAHAYEVQSNETRDAVHPQWKTICKGDLPLKNTTIVDVNLAQKITCNVR